MVSQQPCRRVIAAGRGRVRRRTHGNSSLTLLSRSAPRPEPVPPPSECSSWNPWSRSHCSAWSRSVSMIWSTSSAPSVSGGEQRMQGEARRGRRQSRARHRRREPEEAKVATHSSPWPSWVAAQSSRGARVSRTPGVRRKGRAPRALSYLLPAPLWPLTNVSGLNSLPYLPLRIVSIVPGSRSIWIDRGTYLSLPASARAIKGAWAMGEHRRSARAEPPHGSSRSLSPSAQTQLGFLPAAAQRRSTHR